MNKEKWKDILGKIKDNFEIIDHNKEHIDDEGGVEIEFVVFNGPLGKMRLEFIEKPVILDKKTTYSRRIGSDTKVDYVYSEDEKSHILNIYKWDDNNQDWIEIEANNFNI